MFIIWRTVCAIVWYNEHSMVSVWDLVLMYARWTYGWVFYWFNHLHGSTVSSVNNGRNIIIETYIHVRACRSEENQALKPHTQKCKKKKIKTMLLREIKKQTHQSNTVLSRYALRNCSILKWQFQSTFPNLILLMRCPEWKPSHSTWCRTSLSWLFVNMVSPWQWHSSCWLHIMND